MGMVPYLKAFNYKMKQITQIEYLNNMQQPRLNNSIWEWFIKKKKKIVFGSVKTKKSPNYPKINKFKKNQ